VIGVPWAAHPPVTHTPLPDKLFFKIGEVAQIVGVRPHVLRYWEAELAAFRPMKTRGAHRVYRRRDVELAMLVKGMLKDEGLTIAGAKRRLRELHRERDGAPAESQQEATERVSQRADLLALRRELSELQKALDTVFAPVPVHKQTDLTATVTAAVPSSVPIRGRMR
jgi:DNA-binding transcriptional MerR regulator